MHHARGRVTLQGRAAAGRAGIPVGTSVSPTGAQLLVYPRVPISGKGVPLPGEPWPWGLASTPFWDSQVARRVQAGVKAARGEPAGVALWRGSFR